MIATAPRSSAMATVVRNSFSEVGTRVPSRASTPIAKAMSVAAGIAQPRAQRRIAAGDAEIDQGGHAMPAAAAISGSRRRSQVGEIAVEELALDLQPDEQEEQRHQAVVDPELGRSSARARRQDRAGRGGGEGGDRPRRGRCWRRAAPAPPRPISSSPPAASVPKKRRAADFLRALPLRSPSPLPKTFQASSPAGAAMGTVAPRRISS